MFWVLAEFWPNVVFFFFNDTATTEIYTLSLHDALPISHDGAVLRLDVLLEQRGPVGPEGEPLRRRLKVHARVEPLDERPGAADAGFDQHREVEARARLDELGAVVHDDRPRIREAKPLEELHLERLGLLEPVGRHGIDHRDPERFVVAQERLGVEK